MNQADEDERLRQRLQQLSPADNVPPVTDTTRSALQARLARLEKGAEMQMPQAEKNIKVEEGGDGGTANKGAKSKNSRVTHQQASQRDDVVATYVFLDLEATGLAISRPRITELSMVAVGRDQFRQLQSDLRIKSDSECGCQGDEQPRVLNKLTLCFYPCTQVPHQVTRLTGLDNFNLEDQAKFDVDTLRSFLVGLAKPVCLVAHNGMRYDYPLLLSEIVKAVGEDCKSVISDEVLCLDSLPLMREIFAKEKEVATRIEVEEVSSLVASGVMDDDGQGDEGEDEDDLLDDFKPIRWDREEQTPVVTPTKSLSSEQRVFPLPVTPPTSNSKKRPRMEAAPLPKPCFKNLAANFNNVGVKIPSPPAIPQAVAAAIDEPDEMRDENEVTPDKRIPNSGQPPPAPKRPKKNHVRTQGGAARKRLNFDTASLTGPRGFSLPELHRHLIGRPPSGSSHSAEADCLALMRVCAARRDALIERIGRGAAKPFNSVVKKMW